MASFTVSALLRAGIQTLSSECLSVYRVQRGDVEKTEWGRGGERESRREGEGRKRQTDRQTDCLTY